MWKTIEADGHPPAGTECYVWAPGWPKAKLAEAFDASEARGFSNAFGEIDGVTHWLPHGYPPNPEEAPVKPARKRAA